jgi:hypothetical protein
MVAAQVSLDGVVLLAVLCLPGGEVNVAGVPEAELSLAAHHVGDGGLVLQNQGDSEEASVSGHVLAGEPDGVLPPVPGGDHLGWMVEGEGKIGERRHGVAVEDFFLRAKHPDHVHLGTADLWAQVPLDANPGSSHVRDQEPLAGSPHRAAEREPIG